MAHSTAPDLEHSPAHAPSGVSILAVLLVLAGCTTSTPSGTNGSSTGAADPSTAGVDAADGTTTNDATPGTTTDDAPATTSSTGATTDADTDTDETDTDADEPRPPRAPDPIPKSSILFTQVSTATPENIERYAADGVFWGHMPNASIESDDAMADWATGVAGHVEGNGLQYFGRVEFDWGWKWMIDFMDDPAAYWARNLDGNVVPFHAESTYGGHGWNWQSHHGPDFAAWLTYQVDRMLVAPVTHIMIDSQTSATRTALWFGGDFSPHSMSGFRDYLADRYSPSELAALGIEDIDGFDYQSFLQGQGVTLQAYRNAAYSVPGATPLYEDFTYYQRQRLNETMEQLLAHIEAQAPGVPIGATTSLMEARGWVANDRLTYLAGELSHSLGPLEEVPYNPTTHYKAAEAAEKTLILFPYPAPWQTIRDANAPRHARTWIAQAYAMGAVFTIPGNIWVGGSSTWDPGWENYADLYQFIRANEGLLDGYHAASNVGFVYSMLGSFNTPSMDGNDEMKSSTRTLMERNLSFDYVVFGDPGMPVTPSVDELEAYDVIVTDSNVTRLTDAQQDVLAQTSVPVVSIEDAAAITAQLGSKIDVSVDGVPSNARINALPRTSSDPDDPYVIHLLNREYAPSIDRSVAHADVTVTIGAGFFAEPSTSATVHIVGEDPRVVDLNADDAGALHIDVGSFESGWALVELAH